MVPTDLYENFRGKTTVCERITGTAQERTDTTEVQQSEDARALQRAEGGESLPLLGLTGYRIRSSDKVQTCQALRLISF